MPRVSGAKEKSKKSVSLPTGTVTFLFTDIEGSTQRWEAHREAMQAAVERHDEVLRKAIETHNGYVFKTIGDAFCAAFGRIEDALAAAIDAQRELAKVDFSMVDGLRVRMGLHAGEASERSGDYFGPEVNRVARLMSIGHGGQVLISGAAQQLLRELLPSDATFIDLGLRRLKDLTQPEQVWQLVISGLPQEFPPLNSLDARANNLPIQLTNLFGRERDLEEVKSLASEHRLLTLSGAGGVGKTRLALQAAADLIDRYADGVWFVDLGPISDPELVASVVAKVIGMKQAEGRRVDEAIPQRLKRKQLLLILDNCEHVIEAVAGLASVILAAAPRVRILATSRQALGVGGEFVYRLPSLALPEATTTLTAQNALTYGAVALFVNRATASDTRFFLNDDNAPIVAEICRRLDGIPLAIELAAARVNVLSIPHLAQRLNDRFKILTGGSRTALPRQKTLTALIDWSYDLLTPPEQTFFNRVGIFAGGFSLGAATAVCACDGINESDILDLLTSLTEKSLVTADTRGELERYRLLESTRAYALEKLAAAGERERLARRHGEYFRDLAQAADERFGTGSTLAWLTSLELELDNYRAALDWGLTQGNDPLVGAAIAGALERPWSLGGLSAEGRYWVRCALESVGEAEHPQIVARLWLALALISSGNRACEAASLAVSIYESVGDRRGAARARAQLAWGLSQTGRLEEASEANLRALVTLRECGTKGNVAFCLMQQGSIAYIRGDKSAGRDLFAQSLVVFRAIGDEMHIAIALGNLGELEFGEGHPEQALRSVTEALEIDSRLRVDATSLAVHHSNSAAYQIALGALDGARLSAREGLRCARQAESAFLIAWILQHSALLMALHEQSQNAARLLGYVDVKLKDLGVERQPTEKWGYDQLMGALHEHLSEAQIAKLAAEGAAWSEDKAVEEAFKV